jgi:hypothetical protein
MLDRIVSGVLGYDRLRRKKGLPDARPGSIFPVVPEMHGTTPIEESRIPEKVDELRRCE